MTGFRCIRFSNRLILSNQITGEALKTMVPTFPESATGGNRLETLRFI